jgi:diadenosine tetraphosphate (Ap4A) HIT family hydrolase
LKKLFILILLFSNNLFAHVNYVETISELSGIKYPDGIDETGEPVLTYAMTKRTNLDGFNELLPFVMPSPNQEDAGSCLYMAITGNIEWWLNYLQPNENKIMDGPHDLSERYLMNMAGMEEEESPAENWRTDTVYLFNWFGSVLNSDYPYTKGWFKEEKDQMVIAKPEEKGSSFGTGYNWINEIETFKLEKVDLPKFEREIIFEDEDKNQWNVGVTPSNIIEIVKEALRVNKAPVLITYNHYGYWHVHMIVGFDDNENSHGCKFTKETAPYLKDQAKKFRDKAENESDQEVKEKLERKAETFTKNSDIIYQTMEEIGCKKGVFYVRDSLYSDSTEENYSYHTESTTDDKHYAKKVILREYEYLRALANHVIQINPIN